MIRGDNIWDSDSGGVYIPSNKVSKSGPFSLETFTLQPER